ncbi:hypothetical protein [Streptomyces chilikensis]|uniref:Uncharacterized protein n=1 Tax=Streptomyces chilikensis TaxID=1194079 RepID=A0ABV3EJG1_9ACTN
MALTATGVHDVAEAVLGCVCAALDQVAEEVPGQPGCPCRVCVVPGQVAWDGCDGACGPSKPGGQLSVSVARMWPTTSFPTEDREVRGLRGCSLPATTAVELVVTLLRCAPGPGASGCPPSCEELTDSARILHTDMATLQNAIMCCLPQTAPTRRGRRFVLGAQRVLGPEGGCVGVEQRVTVAMPGCAPCPGEEGQI